MATTPVKKKLKAFQLYAPRTSALLFCMPTFSTLPLAYLLRFFYFIHKNKKNTFLNCCVSLFLQQLMVCH